MKEYAWSIIGIVLLAATLSAIVPEGKTAAVVKGVTKTACLVVILTPIVGFFYAYSSGKDGDRVAETFLEKTVIEEDTAFIQYNCAMRIRLAEESLQKELRELYRVDVVASISWECRETEEPYTEQVVKILSVRLTPEHEIEEDTKKAVCAYVKEKYCSEVLLE